MTQAEAPFEFTAPLTVCVDFRNPHAYLAIEPTRALERRLGIAAEWLPFAAPPLPRPKPAGIDDDRGARHRRIRSLYFERDLARYAQSRGLDLGDVYRAPDTTLAAVGLLWVQREVPARAGAYVALVFDRLWRDNADLALPATIEDALDTVAVGRTGFAEFVAGDGAHALAALQRALAAAGIFNVPAYVVAGEIYFGRQHLPMVAALLGRR